MCHFYLFFLFLCSIFFFLPPKTKELNFDLSILLLPYLLVQTSIVAQLVKNPPAVWETWVQSLGWEDPREKGKPTQSSMLAWRIPWTIELNMTERLSFSLS